MYESYKKKLENMWIDGIDWKCPKCGADIDFWSEPVETYMMDGTLVREDELVCIECDTRVYATQVFAPGKLSIEIEEGEDEW